MRVFPTTHSTSPFHPSQERCCVPPFDACCTKSTALFLPKGWRGTLSTGDGRDRARKYHQESSKGRVHETSKVVKFLDALCGQRRDVHVVSKRSPSSQIVAGRSPTMPAVDTMVSWKHFAANSTHPACSSEACLYTTSVVTRWCGCTLRSLSVVLGDAQHSVQPVWTVV